MILNQNDKYYPGVNLDIINFLKKNYNIIPYTFYGLSPNNSLIDLLVLKDSVITPVVYFNRYNKVWHYRISDHWYSDEKKALQVIKLLAFL